MSHGSKPPKKYMRFIQRFPKLGQAWDLLHDAEGEGPLDVKTQRLIKLAIAIASGKEGATHASVRKAMDKGVTREEMEQVVALTAATLGLPAAVAAYLWVDEEIEKADKH